MYQQSEKNLLSSNISSITSSHNMVNFGPPAAEIGPVVWGTPANFNGFLFFTTSRLPRYAKETRRWIILNYVSRES